MINDLFRGSLDKLDFYLNSELAIFIFLTVIVIHLMLGFVDAGIKKPPEGG